MIKKNMGKILAGSVLMLLPVVVGLLLWNRLPDEVAIHWGIDGNPDGWCGKGMAVFGIPLALLALHWVCMLVSNGDPRLRDQENKAVEIIFWICPVLALFVCSLIYAQGLGQEPNMTPCRRDCWADCFWCWATICPNADRTIPLA
jgi:uncharacterized membrane protein